MVNSTFSQFYVHTWDFTTSIPELMGALHHLVAEGKVLYLGISNTPAWVVTKANEYARQMGFTPFSVYEGQWSAAQREIERDIVPMCSAEGMALTPFGVLGMGYFKPSSHRTTAEQTGQAKDGRNVPFVDHANKTIMADTLERISVARDTSITSVALAWVRTKAPYIFPVIGGRKIEHMKANIDALGLELTEVEIEKIENAVPFDFGYPQTFLGGPGGARESGDVWMTRRLGHFDWVAEPQVSWWHQTPRHVK